MSEMSIIQQIELVKEMKEYIELVAKETGNMREEVDSLIGYLRSEGLPTEVADVFMGPQYMGHANGKLNELLDNIVKEDYRYLEEMQNSLEDVYRY